MSNFKFIDLFSGIGGFHKGLELAGGECVFASEIDKYATKSYEILHGLTPHGDITKIEATNVPDHDILACGFPCQSFSLAGKRRGFEDTRGTLFFEVARIAKEKQPKVIIGENVKGLVSHDNGNTITVILQTLSDLGYSVDFQILNSKYFGVPQNRERVFIIAIKDYSTEPYKIPAKLKNQIVYKRKAEINKLGTIKTFNFAYPKQEKVEYRLRDILETNVDEKFYVSEEKSKRLLVQLEEKYPKAKLVVGEERTDEGLRVFKDEIVGTLRTTDSCGDKRIVEEVEILCVNPKKEDGTQSYQQDRIYQDEGIVPALCASLADLRVLEETDDIVIKGQIEPYQDGLVMGVEGISKTILSGNPKKYILEEPSVNVIGKLDMKGNDYLKRVYDTEGVAPTLTTMGGGNTEPKITVIGNIAHNGRSQTGRVMDTEGIAPCLMACDYKDPQKIYEEVKPSYRVRKLTPLECFRLQGFPDEWYYTLVAEGLSNTQLYKQAGNAVSVPVIKALGEAIKPYLK